MKLSQDEFIKRAHEKHGDKYDYSLVEYKNHISKILIVCPIHGEFLQIANSHLSGKGCIKCGITKRSNGRKNNLEDLIFSFRKKHGEKFDYSKVEYIKMESKVIIKCDLHNIEFLQSPLKHLESKNGGCPKCCNNVGKGILDNNLFIEKASETHMNKYNYSLVNYKKSNQKVKIICPIHNIFEITPNSHLNGQGCSKCSKNYRYNIIELKDIFNQIYENKYEYDFSNFKNFKSLIKVKCPIHSYFNISIDSHKRGYGCSSCGKFSVGEELVSSYLKENKIVYEKQKSFDECVHVNKIQFDFYLSNKNICIEFDGIQHFKPIEYFGGVKAFELQKIKNKIKNDYCDKNNIKLIRIPYYEIKNVDKILENLI